MPQNLYFTPRIDILRYVLTFLTWFLGGRNLDDMLFFINIIPCSPDFVLVLYDTTRVTSFFGVPRHDRKVTHIGNMYIHYRHYAVIIDRT